MNSLISKQSASPFIKHRNQPRRSRLSQRSSTQRFSFLRGIAQQRENVCHFDQFANIPSQVILNHDTDVNASPSCLQSFSEKYQLYINEQPHRRGTPSLLISKRKMATSKQIEYTAKKEPNTLKRLIRRFKTESIVRNFSAKMKRRLTRKIPTKVEDEQQENHTCGVWEWFSHREGTELPSLLSTVLSLFGILSIMLLTLVYSLSLVFPQIESNDLFRASQLFSVIEFFVHIYLSFTVKRYHDGEALVFLSEISVQYLKGRFVIDLANTLLLLIDLIIPDPVPQLKYFRWIVLLKFPEVLEKLQTIENLHITSFYREQYWGLFNVLVINLTFAHFLSIILNAMSHLNDNSNWLKDRMFLGAGWFQQYVWGYYWGTTIMLTVGFGDIAATNVMEAGCLIFIEMISCITLAYNINCVGNLINNLRQQQVEKNNNQKTFQMMVKSNKISRQLQNKINNYIEQSNLIKNQFNFKEQDQLLEGLPAPLRKEYLKAVNKRLFEGLPFLKELTLSSRNTLAQNILRRITHPDEIILNKGETEQCMILSKGILGMTIKRSEQLKNPICVIQTLKVGQQQRSKLLGMGFIKQAPLKFTLKSMSYSILYCISNEDLLQQLRQNSIDYQHFCLQRDKHNISLDFLQLYQCENCVGEFHSKFNCPRLHFMPIRQNIVYRYLKHLKDIRQERRAFDRFSDKNISPMQCRNVITNELKLLRSSVLDWQATETVSILSSDHNMEYLGGISQPKLESVSSEHLQSVSSEKPKSVTRSPTVDPEFIINYFSQINAQCVSFWDVEVDLMHNWHYYFPQDNPDSLRNKRVRVRGMRLLQLL